MLWLTIRANEMLLDTNFDKYMENDIDEGWSKWEEQFLTVMHQCIPALTTKLKKSLPWLTHDFLRAIRLKKSLIEEHRRQEIQITSKVKKKKNKAANMLKAAKFNFFNQLIPLVQKLSGK